MSRGNSIRHLLFAASLPIAVLLAACDPTDSALQESPTATPPSTVPVAAWHLQPAGSEAAVVDAMASGRVRWDSHLLLSQRELGAPLAEATFGGAPAADSGSGGGGAAGGGGGGIALGGEEFSNVQVAGVEEPDVTKTNGEQLFIAEQPFRWIYPVAMPAVIDVVDPVVGPVAAARIVPRDGIDVVLDDPLPGILPPENPPEPPAPRIARYRLDPGTPASATPLPPLELPNVTGWINRLDLLLSGGAQPVLVAMGQSSDWGWQRWFAPVKYQPSQELRLWLYDVRDLEAVPDPVNVVLKGELVDSRRIGDNLYVVSRYTPSSDTDPVLPLFTVDGVEHQVANPVDCLLSSAAAEKGYPSLMMVTAVNLHAPAQSRASCYVGEVYTLYMSPDALYLSAVQPNPDYQPPTGGDGGDASGGGEGGVLIGGGGIRILPPVAVASSRMIARTVRNAPVETVIHRFALESAGPRYTGSGRVPGGFTGWLGAGSNPQWRFHQREHRLFVVTSWWSETDLEHHLTVLEPGANGDLEAVATLPNTVHPEAIGKPREDIHAIRYVGDRAYIVTFQQTDPLYVLDLSNPLDPRVAGELEMPGFSAYLHPVADGWMLGVGQGANRGEVEANLFDVRDISAPLVHATIPICHECDAPILTDYHAFAWQAHAGGLRAALPVQRWIAVDDERYYAPLDEAVLIAATADGSLASPGRLAADSHYTGLGRAFLVGGAVYQPQVGNVTAHDWPTAAP